jgi:hypothetical protein
LIGRLVCHSIVQRMCKRKRWKRYAAFEIYQ